MAKQFWASRDADAECIEFYTSKPEKSDFHGLAYFRESPDCHCIGSLDIEGVGFDLAPGHCRLVEISAIGASE